MHRVLNIVALFSIGIGVLILLGVFFVGIDPKSSPAKLAMADRMTEAGLTCLVSGVIFGALAQMGLHLKEIRDDTRRMLAIAERGTPHAFTSAPAAAPQPAQPRASRFRVHGVDTNGKERVVFVATTDRQQAGTIALMQGLKQVHTVEAAV